MPDASSPAFSVSVRLGRVGWRDQTLWDSLDFTLAGGQWTCLLGASGIGKTTLLRLIAGIDDSADAAVACSDGAPLRGRVAWMAQHDLLLPWLSVLDNALLGERLRGGDRRGRRGAARDLLARVGLGDKCDARPASLSGGERQRAALVRTLMEDRPVILMDEPFSALDAITRLAIQDLAARLLAGRTVLLVTHDPREALRLGHRIHVMSGKPARLEPAQLPHGVPPRALDDPALPAMEAEIVRRLADSAGAGR
ncbi:MAG: ABC transporter ATP-binding protein [Alphaproteobacteria bacterium]|nr:ABC transporter ATP-binding protein [Alphaproteobacteria bacterium]